MSACVDNGRELEKSTSDRPQAWMRWSKLRNLKGVCESSELERQQTARQLPNSGLRDFMNSFTNIKWGSVWTYVKSNAPKFFSNPISIMLKLSFREKHLSGCSYGGCSWCQRTAWLFVKKCYNCFSLWRDAGVFIFSTHFFCEWIVWVIQNPLAGVQRLYHTREFACECADRLHASVAVRGSKIPKSKILNWETRFPPCFCIPELQ